MRLSNAEKIILLLLADIYEHLDIEGVNPELIREAIYSNNLWALEWYFQMVPFDDEPVSHEVVHEVVDILEMWNAIEVSYEQLSQEERERVAAEAEPFGRNPRFPGIDLNTETEHYSVATMLIDHLGRFSRFRGRDLQSHHPVLEAYRRMLKVYIPLRDNEQLPLSADNLIAILQEQVHPSNR